MASALAQKFMMFALLLGVVGITCWSWVLIDPNFTLLNHLDWARFRELMISIGYYNRQLSSQLYVGLIIWISVFSYLVVRFYRKSLLLPIIFIGVVAGLVSYPALSHDLFNYIFDARIVTYYHANPYLLRAMDFGADPMIRFMHWIHRTYPYGPSYLLTSLIPSFLGFGVFSLTFFLFKLMQVGLYILSSFALVKLNRKAAIIFVTSPLVIVEGLVNTHNDFVAVALAIIGIYLLSVQRNKLSALLLLTSGLIKYVTLPLVILIKIKPLDTLLIKLKHKFVWLKTIKSWHIAFVGTLALVTYLSLHMEVQPWYFLNLFIFVVYIPNFFRKFWIAIFGLVLCYYPYVIGGQWGQGGDVVQKKIIIITSFIVNIIFILIIDFKKFSKLLPFIKHNIRNKLF